jgi:predicted nucleotidyltransferase
MVGDERETLRLSEMVATRLGGIEGVEAVALGGSWARGETHPNSDVDLGIYYRPESPPRIENLRLLARELDDRHPPEAVTDFGEWGPWINGGGWLTIDGQNTDWLYRDLALVERTIGECHAGHPSAHYQPGHPHGFHTHIYMGEVHYCMILYEQNGGLSALKRLTEVYPLRLKRALVKTQLWEASFALKTSWKSAERGDSFYVAGCLFRCAACLVQVLFALNERYLINEKGSVAATDNLPLRPEDFRETVESVLACPGKTSKQLVSNIRRLEEITKVVEKLCAEPLRDPENAA